MKFRDLFKTKEKEILKVEEATPVIIPLIEGQTYKDLVYEELGDNVRAVKAEIEELNKEFNHVSDILEKQGHLARNVKDKNRFGHEILKDSWSTRAEELFAPRRRKLNNLKQKLEASENKLRVKVYVLLSMAEKLDHIVCIKHRERVYGLAARKINELIPLMGEVNKCNFDVNYNGGYNTCLSAKFNNFVSTFQDQNPGSVDEAALKVEFFKELEKVKAEFEKDKELEELREFEAIK
jgi:hypothetical protein